MTKLFHVSDVHFGAEDPAAIAWFARCVAEERPDAVVMTGDLTITDVTRPVTFDVTVTPTAAGTLTGSASTTFAYADFSLDIPASQSVQAVADELRLELTFTAVEGA